MSLKNAIRKSRGLSSPEADVSWEGVIKTLIEQTVANALQNIESQLRPELAKLVSKIFNEHFDELKGEPGKDGDVKNIGQIAARAAQMIAVPTAAEVAAHVAMPSPKEIAAHVKPPPVDEQKIAGRVMDLLSIPDEDAIVARLKVELAAIDEMQDATQKPITINDIAGLDRELKQLGRSIRESARSKEGGGVGNPQHESFPVTSVTTQIATTYRVAANGKFIWMYYNGQELFRGRHYTAPTNQKTFPLLFTPDDPLPGQTNAIDVLYIRT